MMNSATSPALRAKRTTTVAIIRTYYGILNSAFSITARLLGRQAAHRRVPTTARFRATGSHPPRAVAAPGSRGPAAGRRGLAPAARFPGLGARTFGARSRQAGPRHRATRLPEDDR